MGCVPPNQTYKETKSEWELAPIFDDPLVISNANIKDVYSFCNLVSHNSSCKIFNGIHQKMEIKVTIKETEKIDSEQGSIPTEVELLKILV